MFLIHVQIDFCLHYPVEAWPYARFVSACECNEVIVKKKKKKRIQRLFLYLEEHFFLHLCGYNSLYIKVRKTTKGQKNELHTASVSHTVHVCSAQQSKAVSAFSEPFLRK